ncbi:MAG: PilW family protein [Rudaea sp.]|uniref:PilW family protein n=1 Tax=unclassified Rudaea TaxID=2627037 RepID=UPI001484EB16|nr:MULTISPECIES: PilW family protein [unclassified Rudaea]MBN8886570.1 PilW family protein [Rudaea sp.]MBR0343893.1 PilW family protein [Rudaea sp.]
MSRSTSTSPERCGVRNRARGFGLLEVMIAMALGLLLSLGIVTVFSAVGATNRVEDALARLQENGRYASIRMAADLRMLGGQYCSTASAADANATPVNGVVYPNNAILSWAPGAGAASLGTTANALPDGGGIAGAVPSGTDLTMAPYALSPAISAQGYDCGLSDATCGAVPSGSANAADGLPPIGTAVGNRVQGADVLTIRYQSGTGWAYTLTGVGSGNNATFILNPQQNPQYAPPAVPNRYFDDDPTDPRYSFTTGDRALVTKCSGGQIFQVSVAGTGTTPTLSPDPTVPISSTFKVDDPSVGHATTFDARVFNFTKNFVTVTYYLSYQADPATAGRVVPTLMRKVNGGANQGVANQGDEVVQGVERLDFLYGVQYKSDGGFHYLTAAEVTANSNLVNCAVPAGVTDPTGCLWGSVRSVQVNMLLNSVGNLPLSDAETVYSYSVDGGTSCTPPSSAADNMTYCVGGAKVTNGSKAGRLMRREFISMVAVRNGNR